MPRKTIDKTIETVASTVDEYFRRGPIRGRIRLLWRGMREHHSTRAASAMAFDLFLAAIPMLALTGWLFGLVLRDNPAARDTLSLILNITPGQVHDVFLSQLGRFSAGVAPFAVAGSLWLASSAFHTVMTVFERALHAKPRPWIKKRLIALGCVLALILGFALSAWIIVTVAGGPAQLLFRTLDTLHVGPDRPGATRWLSLLMTAVAVTGLVAAFYRIAVNRPGVSRRIWPGAIVTVGMGALASYGFAVYARNLARYTVFYGSLAGMVVLLAWLWLCCMALLIGAELNAQLEGVERLTRAPDAPDASDSEPPSSEPISSSEPSSSSLGEPLQGARDNG